MKHRAIAAYADAFNQRFTCAPGVASPLGAWLLLAIVAPLATGPHRRALEGELGLDAEEAASYAAALLADPPAVVRAALAVWPRETALTETFASWAPPHVERGDVPSQEAADAWARAATDGLVDRLPAVLDDDTVLVLTSALLTRLTWSTALDTDPDGRLVLRDHHGWQALVETADAGVVAVAEPRSGSGLRVLSVIAAPEVAPAAVHRAALEICTGHPVAVLPSSDGHAWTSTERRELRRSWEPVETTFTSYLPAWRLESRHDLTDAPGVPSALEVLGGLVRPDVGVAAYDAVQAAAAAYTATGFEAAAVTALAVAGRAAAPDKREVLVREITVSFDRPHAVVAVVSDVSEHYAWRGVPVFGAWVDPVTP